MSEHIQNKTWPNDAVKPPVFADVEFINFKWAKVKDIPVDRKKNARVGDIDPRQVAKWNSTIIQNKYKHFAFFPPIYDKTVKRLISGHHKYQSHVLTKQEYIFIAEVKSKNESVSDYYASYCNKPQDEFINTPRKYEDIVNDVRKQLEHDGYTKSNPPTENYIANVLKTLAVTPIEANKSQVIRDIAKQFGVIENLKTYSETEAKEYIEETYGLTECKKGPKQNVTYKKYNNDKEIWDDDIVWFLNLSQQRKKHNKPDLKTKRFISFENINDVKHSRENRIASISKIEKYILDAAEIIKSKDYVRPEMIPLPQKDSDYESNS